MYWRRSLSRAGRLGLVAVLFVSSIAAALALTWFSSASEGPLVATLVRVGTGVGAMEHEIRQRLSGELGRSGNLAWFEPYRTDITRLRRPDIVLLGAYDNAIPGTLDGMVELDRALGTT